jgi:hypothetical protein
VIGEENEIGKMDFNVDYIEQEGFFYRTSTPNSSSRSGERIEQGLDLLKRLEIESQEMYNVLYYIYKNPTFSPSVGVWDDLVDNEMGAWRFVERELYDSFNPSKWNDNYADEEFNRRITNNRELLKKWLKRKDIQQELYREEFDLQRPLFDF